MHYYFYLFVIIVGHVKSDDEFKLNGGPLDDKRSFHYQQEDKNYEELKKFLDSYTKNKNYQQEEEQKNSWNYQKPNNPYDDRKGWVSMEPVPWTVSKISKWQSHEKTTQRPWDLYDERPDEPQFIKKPTAIYSHRVHVQTSPQTKPYKYHNDYQKPYDSPEIIIDDSPPNFPKNQEYHRRQSTELHRNHPFEGSGEWVLVSTTKGYKYPHERQRALKLNPEPMRTTKSVSLTVLPPAKNSKVNMTTSHGGLLQVESTFETIEQARKRALKNNKKKPNGNGQKVKNKKTMIGTTVRRSGTTNDPSAVLAAVGAGMIPATMAMLVPVALSGRKKREIVINRYETDI